MKKKIVCLLTILAMICMACSMTLFVAADVTEDDVIFGNSMDILIRDGVDKDNFTFYQSEDGKTSQDGRTVFAGTYVMRSEISKEANQSIAIRVQAPSLVFDEETPAVIKWAEYADPTKLNYAEYYIHIGAAYGGSDMVFTAGWGGAATVGAGSLKLSLSVGGQTVATADGSATQCDRGRGIWSDNIISFVYNETSGKYGVKLTMEGWDGSGSKTVNFVTEDGTPYEVDGIPGGGYVSIIGYNNPADGAVTDLYLYEVGAFDNLPRAATVKTEAGFDAALADPTVSSITFANGIALSKDKTIDRALNMKFGTWTNDPVPGNAFSGAKVTFGPNYSGRIDGGSFSEMVFDGCKNVILSSTAANALANSESGYAVTVKNGAQVTWFWGLVGSLSVDKKVGGVYVDGTSSMRFEGQFGLDASAYASQDIVAGLPEYLYFTAASGAKVTNLLVVAETGAQVSFDQTNNANVKGYSSTNSSDTKTYYIRADKVTDFAINDGAAETSLQVGQGYNVEVKNIVPEKPTYPVFDITSSDPSVLQLMGTATDTKATFVAMKPGTVTVTVSSKDGDTDSIITKSVTVTVTEAVMTGFEVNANAVKKEYALGEELDLSGLVVTAQYEYAEDAVLSAEQYTVDTSAYKKDTAGTYEIKVTVGDFAAQSFSVEVKAPVETGFRVDATALKKEYKVGETLDLSGLKVYAVYNVGDEVLLTQGESGYTVDSSAFDSSKAGTYTLHITYKEYAAQEVTVTVAEDTETGGNDPVDPPESGCSGSSIGAFASVGILTAAFAVAAIIFKRK